MTHDEDIYRLTAEELRREVIKLRAAIRNHRDAAEPGSCQQQPQLWSVLPEGFSLSRTAMPWPDFLRSCLRYRQTLEANTNLSPPSSNRQPRTDEAASTDAADVSHVRINLGLSLADAEKIFILGTLKRCGGVRERTAAMLSISQKTLYTRLKEYGE
jgi:DNA-binding NtrC family response regulator